MNAISVETLSDKYLISIDKNAINKDYLFRLLEKVRIEYLAQAADFDEEIEQLGEEIKKDWWQKNKQRFIKE
jgi:hypothetical protein